MPKKVWYAPNKFESYGEEEIKAVEDCLRDGWLAGFGDRTVKFEKRVADIFGNCLLYTSPSPRDLSTSRMPSSA